jgi:CDP-diacylglycerol--glycerol-3-phosphate 3-phosphatidyltransferase/cardiolipin synthase
MADPAAPGFFSLEELLLPPNVLSLLRLPLAAAFPFAARSRGSAMVVLGLAGLTDVFDGWLARRSGQVTTTGAVLDPIADKVFALSVVATLVSRGKLPAWGIAALLTREILEAPLLAWVLLVRSPRRADDVAGYRSNVPGKVATVAQFAAVMAAIEAPALLPAALAAAAAAGAVAGVAYWTRELGREPAEV